MTKGKPWPAEDERKLRDWFTSGVTNLQVLAFSFNCQYTQEAIRQKLLKFGLLKEQQQLKKNECCCSTQLELPDELPTVEEELQVLAAAINALKNPGLSKDEILRLRGLIAGAKVYQERFGEYVGYRKIELELLEAKKKYEELRKRVEGTSSK
jgi:hypothetical protein